MIKNETPLFLKALNGETVERPPGKTACMDYETSRKIFARFYGFKKQI